MNSKNTVTNYTNNEQLTSERFWATILQSMLFDSLEGRYNQAMDSDLLIIKTDIDNRMFNLIRERTKARPTHTLLMAVATAGGDPVYAYRAMLYLRSVYQEIFYLVFDKAMSAGTLMALGANAIYLAEGACLGPLDLQIPHPRDDSKQISALDVRDTASSIAFEASDIMLKMCAQNINAGLRPTAKAIDAAVKLTSNLYKPIMDKIDPFRLHESYRNAELSTRYGTELLCQAMVPNQNEASQISMTLANEYPYHGYAIMKTEAKSLGLKIMDFPEISEYTDLYAVKSAYDRVFSGEIRFLSAHNSPANNSRELKRNNNTNGKVNH